MFDAADKKIAEFAKQCGVKIIEPRNHMDRWKNAMAVYAALGKGAAADKFLQEMGDIGKKLGYNFGLSSKGEALNANVFKGVDARSDKVAHYQDYQKTVAEFETLKKGSTEQPAPGSEQQAIAAAPGGNDPSAAASPNGSGAPSSPGAGNGQGMKPEEAKQLISKLLFDKAAALDSKGDANAISSAEVSQAIGKETDPQVKALLGTVQQQFQREAAKPGGKDSVTVAAATDFVLQQMKSQAGSPARENQGTAATG